MRTRERPDPVFIVARNWSSARTSAMDLGLPPSDSTGEWHYVSDWHCVRGRRQIRVHFGPDAHLHCRYGEIVSALERIEEIGELTWVEPVAGGGSGAD